MNKKRISIISIVMVLFLFISTSFGYNTDFVLNDGKITLGGISDWITIARDNYDYVPSSDYDFLSITKEHAESVFNDNDDLIFVSYYKDLTLWCNGTYDDSEEYGDSSAYSDEELLENETYDNGKLETENGTITIDSVYESSGYKYIVLEGVSTDAGVVKYMRSYSTAVDDVTYSVWFYSNSKFTSSMIEKAESFIDVISYSKKPVSKTGLFAKSYFFNMLKNILIVTGMSVVSFIVWLKKGDKNKSKETSNELSNKMEYSKDVDIEIEAHEIINAEENSNTLQEVDQISANVEEENADEQSHEIDPIDTIGDNEDAANYEMLLSDGNSSDDELVDEETTTNNDEVEKDISEIPSDSLRALKSLFDSGVLTEEEFVEKKKKLLGL